MHEGIRHVSRQNSNTKHTKSGANSDIIAHIGEAAGEDHHVDAAFLLQHSRVVAARIARQLQAETRQVLKGGGKRLPPHGNGPPAMLAAYGLGGTKLQQVDKMWTLTACCISKLRCLQPGCRTFV